MLLKNIKLKLILLSAFMLGIGTFSLNSCKKETNVSENKPAIAKFEELNIPEEFNTLGRLHAEALDSVFESIRAATLGQVLNAPDNAIKSVRSKIDYESIIDKSVLKFCKTNTLSSKSYTGISSVKDMKTTFTKAKFQSIEKGEYRVAGLNPIQQNLMLRARSVLKGKRGRSSLPKLKDEFEKINREAAEKLTENEANVIYCATGSLFASYQYWMTNHRKWFFILAYPKVARDFIGKNLNDLRISKSTGKKSGLSVSSDEETYWGGVLPEVIITLGYTEDSFWDVVEDFWVDHGADIMYADTIGATEGILHGTYAGLLPGAVVGALGGFVGASASGYIWDWLSGFDH